MALLRLHSGIAGELHLTGGAPPPPLEQHEKLGNVVGGRADDRCCRKQK